MLKPLKKLVRLVGAQLAEKPTVVSRYGPKLLRRKGDDTFNSCWTGKYGSFTSSIIESIDEPFVLFDVGANIGIYSLIGHTNPHCDRIFAFEPVPATFRYLVGNIELNDAQKVVPICGAITNETARPLLPMSFKATHSGVSQIADSASDSVVFTAALGSDHLDFLGDVNPKCRIVMKIDVEGAELFVLRAVRQSNLLDRITDIIVEVSSKYHDTAAKEELLGFLEDCGFSEARRDQQPGRTLYDALYTKPRVGSR